MLLRTWRYTKKTEISLVIFYYGITWYKISKNMDIDKKSKNMDKDDRFEGGFNDL